MNMIENIINFAIKNPFDTAFIIDENIILWNELIKKIIFYQKNMSRYQRKRILIYFDNFFECISFMLGVSMLEIEVVLLPAYYPEIAVNQFVKKLGINYI